MAMVKFPVTEKPPRKRPVVRIGRPPQELAGEVEHRILDAARRVFLERGLAGASVDEIARQARAGKPTIYARFPTKQALFAAVGMRNGAEVIARFERDAPTGTTLEERLVSVGTHILKCLLVSDVIDFMRLSIAEARRFPDLANFGRMARERATRAVHQVLSDVAHADERGRFPAFSSENLPTTARFFMDLVVSRLLMRALTGESLKQLRSEIGAHVAGSVAFFLAACHNSDAAKAQ
jgi:AcrR family transcriptional regulator